MPNQGRPKISSMPSLAGLLHNFGYLAISPIIRHICPILSRIKEANAHLSVLTMKCRNCTLNQRTIVSCYCGYWAARQYFDAIRYSKKPHFTANMAILANHCMSHSSLRNEGSLSHQFCRKRPDTRRGSNVSWCVIKIKNNLQSCIKWSALIIKWILSLLWHNEPLSRPANLTIAALCHSINKVKVPKTALALPGQTHDSFDAQTTSLGTLTVKSFDRTLGAAHSSRGKCLNYAQGKGGFRIAPVAIKWM